MSDNPKKVVKVVKAQPKKTEVEKQEPVVEELPKEKTTTTETVQKADPVFYKKKSFWLIVAAAVFALILFGGLFGDSNDTASNQEQETYAESLTNTSISQSESETNSTSYVTNTNSVWLNGYTDINDFEYYVDGNEIYIKRYKGNSDKVRVASSYEINGVSCNVVSFEDATFIFSRVNSVVIPNGTKYLANNTFNTSGVTFLYLPNTLIGIEDSFWGYFHDVQKIYFGGTQEEWNNLYNYSRGDLGVKEIVFNQNPDELK